MTERLTLPVPVDEISDDASLFGGDVGAGDVGLDSLASLELSAALSDRFQLLLDDVEPSDFRSIRTLADYLRRKNVAADDVDQ
ncbi:MAG: acyl carrier protein [Candidatus Eremiobacteraeota bacterium]|nr:acyl carrier protein [Candidatus Eremiobacteraeota bacterium]